MLYFHICKGCLAELCDEYGVGSDLGFIGDVMITIEEDMDKCDYVESDNGKFAFENRDVTQPLPGYKYMKPYEAQI